MIQTINLHDFRQAFHNMGRGEQFSYEALELIYDFFEDCDPDWDLDVIAICCDFEEMTEEDIRSSYDLESDTDVEKYLSHHTSYIGQTSDGLLVYQSF